MFREVKTELLKKSQSRQGRSEAEALLQLVPLCLTGVDLGPPGAAPRPGVAQDRHTDRRAALLAHLQALQWSSGGWG